MSSHPCLPFCWSHCKQQGLFAPRELPRFTATTDPSATLSPFHRFPGVSGYPVSFFPLISQRDEEGFSSCLAHPCHRAVAVTPPEWLAASVSLRRSMLPSPHEGRLGLWGFRFEAISAFTLVTARCLAHHPKDGFVDRLSGFDSSPPCYPSYRVLASTLVRFSSPNTPAFPWTHQHAGLSRRSPACSSSGRIHRMETSITPIKFHKPTWALAGLRRDCSLTGDLVWRSF